MDTALVGRWAVVTGASKGIGRAIARRLHEGGANVVLVARDRGALNDVAMELEAKGEHGQEVVPLAADVADIPAILGLFEDIRHRIPVLHTFVANAGTGHITPFLELSREEWEEVIALNLTGTVFAVQQAARMMRDLPADDPSILVVSSIRAETTLPGRLAYAASKAGLNQSVRVAARELAPLGIRVNALSPGITATPMTAANPDVFAEVSQSVPLGRAAQPDGLADAAYFLCGPHGRFITGANLVVDGGESLL